MTSEFDARAYALSLLKEPTDRDKQVKIGASNMSSLCTRCLGDDMLVGQESEVYESPFWLGAVIGTAVHLLLEERGKSDPDTLTESKLVIGTIPGYGEVKSTMDVYHAPSHGVLDWKTTTREKLVFIKRAFKEPYDEHEVTKLTEARFKVNGYLNQGMLYGKGALLAGLPVENVSLVFVCRDGQGDKDVWAKTVPFDPEHAEKVWNRAVNLWNALQDGRELATLPSHPMCWFCNTQRDWSTDHGQEG